MKIHDFDHQDLISQIAGITHIERGTLTEEYRERPNPEGGSPLKTGPYYKHQCWEDKRVSTPRWESTGNRPTPQPEARSECNVFVVPPKVLPLIFKELRPKIRNLV